MRAPTKGTGWERVGEASESVGRWYHPALRAIVESSIVTRDEAVGPEYHVAVCVLDAKGPARPSQNVVRVVCRDFRMRHSGEQTHRWAPVRHYFLAVRRDDFLPREEAA